MSRQSFRLRRDRPDKRCFPDPPFAIAMSGSPVTLQTIAPTWPHGIEGGVPDPVCGIGVIEASLHHC
jgi:hypothetical protein